MIKNLFVIIKRMQPFTVLQIRNKIRNLVIKGSTDAKEKKKVVHWRKVEGRVIAKSVFRTAIRQKYLVTEVLSDFSESFSAPLKASQKQQTKSRSP